ncbi:aspartate/tyrosine/aromatic aminotransferase [Helicobacter sp. 11S02629-2]|uniref:aspartate/tyrosine/aromatic aminotransferase n=1 Tax=Helicobacter sp. 11S02629-2 TaxID=1476195 RepID=UPI000BA5C8F2|nr:aspartate/tyrosine/aromatic aminotransferase [Helicobacter sp. 11S02629-2]PAF45555.1 hypothetical protein BKH40_01345 [Helicobacter sp. 11S02629-2]
MSYSPTEDKFKWQTLQDAGFIAYLDSMDYSNSGIYNHFLYKNAFKRLDIYEDLESIKNFKALLLPNSVDEVFLHRNKGLIKAFLEEANLQQPKILVSFASNFLPWLPGNSLYTQSKQDIKTRFIKQSKHRIFSGVSEYDLNYRRGVKGFFNRGFFNPPPNAEVILKDNESKCVAYIDSTSTPSTILATAGADLLSYGIFDTNTARRMGLNLLNYLSDFLKPKDTKGERL